MSVAFWNTQDTAFSSELFWTITVYGPVLILHVNCYCTVTTDDGYWIWCSTRMWGLWEMMLYCLVQVSCCFKGSCLYLHGLQVQEDCFDCLIMKTEVLESITTAQTTMPMPQHHIPDDYNPQQHHTILQFCTVWSMFNPYPTAFPYRNGMVLHFYLQQESSTTKPVHKVVNKGLKTYV